MRFGLSIEGTVRVAPTRRALSGVYVHLAIDERDGAILGTGRTDQRGRFRITAGIDEDLWEERPTLAFRVVHPERGDLRVEGRRPKWKADERAYDLVVSLPEKPRGEVVLVGPDGLPVDQLEPGDDLRLRVAGLEPASPVTAAIQADDALVATTQLITDVNGTLGPVVVWPQLGLGPRRGDEPVSIDEAERQWSGVRIQLELTQDGREVGRASTRVADHSTGPLVVSVDERMALRNAAEAREAALVIAGRRIPGSGRHQLSLVPRQSRWQVGDPVEPARLRSGRPAVVDIDVDRNGRFERRLFRPGELAVGAYDLVLRLLRYGWEDDEYPYLTPRDVIGGLGVTGLVIREEFMASKFARGGCTNLQPIAGRKLTGSPYFRYSDVFAIGEEVWGALDPNALDPTHVGKMVAFYVVPHKTAAQWSADRSLAHLPVLGGNPAVQQLLTQDGCINANDVLLWPSAEIGEYDVVADFGNNTADASAFAPDDSFDDPLDIIDGYAVAGFRVVDDPATMAEFPGAGRYEYDEPAVTVHDDQGSSVSVPVRASVWFPSDSPSGPSTDPVGDISAARASYPVFVAVHGQSGDPDSYLGYEYLLEHLGKNGFIAASVHCQSGMRAHDRAEVLFHHLERLNALFGAKLENNVCIMGHSRGGEAVATAPRLNVQQGRGWQLQGAIALAPTDRYTFESIAGAWSTPFQVIYGSMDGDVAGISRTGFRLYDRASGSSKHMHFVYGSTHGRYNTVWGDTDITEWWSQLEAADHPELISPAAHETIARAFMTAFALKVCRGQNQWDGLLAGDFASPAVAAADGGSVRIYTQHRDAGPDVIDDFETGAGWVTSSSGQAVDDGNALPVDPSEGDLAAGDAHSPHDTSGLSLRWDQTSDSLWFDVPPALWDTSGSGHLSFRVTQRVGSTENPGDYQDLYAALADGSGAERAIRVSKFAEIPEPHARARSHLTKSAMNTVRIPLHAWSIRVAGNMGIDLTDVRRVRFDFAVWNRSTGEIAIDDVEFGN